LRTHATCPLWIRPAPYYQKSERPDLALADRTVVIGASIGVAKSRATAPRPMKSTRRADVALLKPRGLAATPGDGTRTRPRPRNDLIVEALDMTKWMNSLALTARAIGQRVDFILDIVIRKSCSGPCEQSYHGAPMLAPASQSVS